ncbi:MAG TPA: TonB-dependent receptor [Candidatus Acidoferrales bacterium]|nr:TonB-dependent receptor [Candidatus Acidoferrales bacterium]
MFKKLVFAAVLLGPLVFGQSERGSLTGVVLDATGAPIPNVPVVITNRATNAAEHVTTTTAGEFAAPNLAPGTYRIAVTVSGFRRFVEDGITLTAGATVRTDARLQLGQVTESIEVQAQAEQMQTENARVSTAVENKLVDQLPLVVGGALRSPFDLVSTVAEAKGSGSALSLGGGQAASWSATLDGLSVNTNRSGDAGETAYLTPSVESITEFAVDTNGFKAEYGQAGGGVITFASKSGTNAFHGTAYDFLRNDHFDARGFFAKTRSIYKQNDFGASAGGPVVVPKLYNGRNRTFFFLSYEGFRNRLGSNGTILTVPTPEMYKGDFSNWVNSKGALLPIYDPVSTAPNPSGSGFVRTPFPGNQIPTSRFSGISQKILPYAEAVAPNRAGLVPGTPGWISNNYLSNGGVTESPTDKGSVKIDQNFGSNHHVAFFYNRTRYDSAPGPSGPSGLPEPLWNGQVSSYTASLYRTNYDWTISPRMFNHFSIGGNKFFKNSYSPNSGQDWKGKICIPNAVDCNVNFPNVGFSEFTGWGSTTYNGTDQPSWSLKDDLSYVRGAHTLKFGYAFESQRANGFGEQNISGQASFSFLETAVPGATSFTSGSSFASFLLGAADSGATETIRLLPQTYSYHGFYAQDDWRLSQRLVLNLGLRYEFTRPPRAGGDQYSDFSPTTPNPAINNAPGAVIFAGNGPGRTGTRSLIPGWYGAWGPRLGLAYSVDSKTTVRAGFSRSFSRVTVVSGTSHYSGFIGQYAFASPNQGITPAFYWDQGLPSYPLPPQINPAFANNGNVDYWNGYDATRAPEALNWTLSLQRQLSGNTVLEADYNATAGTHLQTGIININQVPMAVVNQLIQQYGATAAINLLNSNILSAQAVAAGIPIPYANFTNAAVQRSQTVSQALRPYPQYLTIDTSQGGGDKSGHSTYHALGLRLNRRMATGLTMQWSYTLSKLLTDSDTYYANAGFAEDNGNRRLEKSIGAYDQTHVLKLNTVYDLPFGNGHRWLRSGIANQVLGGWRLSAIQVYASGFPIGVTRNSPLPIFNGQNRAYITTYDGWRAPVSGSFDPAVNLFLNAAAFPAQPNSLLGNETRFNPKLRAFPNLAENVSIGKSFAIREPMRLDFRAEAFNLFNRTVFSPPTTNLNSTSFGVVSNQANLPRQMQVALKLYW